MSTFDPKREPAPIKVVDRRRFTPAGEARRDVPPSDERPAAVRPVQAERARAPARTPPPAEFAPPPAADATTEDQAEPAPRLEFLPFIASLATQALAALGLMPEGQAQGMPQNPQIAREYIDIIIMLERRTRGNLSAEEARTMQQLITDLRMQYVEATRSVQPARGFVPPGMQGPSR